MTDVVRSAAAKRSRRRNHIGTSCLTLTRFARTDEPGFGMQRQERQASDAWAVAEAEVFLGA
jgi:hypothetical protein